MKHEGQFKKGHKGYWKGVYNEQHPQWKNSKKIIKWSDIKWH